MFSLHYVFAFRIRDRHECVFAEVIVLVSQLLQAMISHKHIEPALEVENGLRRQAGKGGLENVLHSVFCKVSVVEVFVGYTQQKGRIPL